MQKSIPGTKRKASEITLSKGRFISIGVIGVIALIWVFLLGIFVGRGYKPEDTVPQLAQVLPQAKEPPSNTPPAESLLKTEDLEFFNQVKEKPTTQDTAPQVAANDSAPKPSAVLPPKKQEEGKPAAAPKNPEKQGTAPKPTPQKTAAAQKPKPEKQAVVPKKPAAEEKCRYVYQVAAYKELRFAETLVGKLKAKKIQARVKTSTRNANTWHRVLVSYTGTPESIKRLKEQLAAEGLGKPIVVSKVVVK